MQVRVVVYMYLYKNLFVGNIIKHKLFYKQRYCFDVYKYRNQIIPLLVLFKVFIIILCHFFLTFSVRTFFICYNQYFI